MQVTTSDGPRQSGRSRRPAPRRRWQTGRGIHDWRADDSRRSGSPSAADRCRHALTRRDPAANRRGHIARGVAFCASGLLWPCRRRSSRRFVSPCPDRQTAPAPHPDRRRIAGMTDDSFFASASAIVSRVLRDPHARRVHARAAAVVRHRLGDHVDVLLPLVGEVGTDHDLAVAGAVHFDAAARPSIASSIRHRRTPCRGRSIAGSRCRRRDRSGSRRMRPAGAPALTHALMMRSGVHGSALPGFSTSGIFNTVRRRPQRMHAG